VLITLILSLECYTSTHINCYLLMLISLPRYSMLCIKKLRFVNFFYTNEYDDDDDDDDDKDNVVNANIKLPRSFISVRPSSGSISLSSIKSAENLIAM